MVFSRIIPIILFLAAYLCLSLAVAAGDPPRSVLAQLSTAQTPVSDPGSSAGNTTPPAARGATAPLDPNLDYASVCETMQALKAVASARTGRLDADAQFAELRDARQKVVQTIQQVSNKRDLLKKNGDDRRSQLQQSLAPRTMAEPAGPSIEAMRKEMTDLVLDADVIQRQIEDARKQAIIADKTPDIDALMMKRDDNKRRGTQLAADIDNALGRAKAASEQAKREEALYIETRNAIAKNEAAVQAATTDIECLNALQNKIDADIYSALIPETQKNQFKLWMSGLFALMVLVVILGFFTVSLKDASIRAAIFSNQTGIQFVTLFSLVIAIILFGITGILEAKELSALLGGISGYILGRVTTDKSSASSAAARRTETVKSKTIAFAPPNLITDSHGGLEVFAVNSRIRVKGSAANSGDYTVTAVSATELTTAEQSIKPESAGAGITVANI